MGQSEPVLLGGCAGLIPPPRSSSTAVAAITVPAGATSPAGFALVFLAHFFGSPAFEHGLTGEA